MIFARKTSILRAMRADAAESRPDDGSVANPRDSWPTWTDQRWTIVPTVADTPPPHGATRRAVLKGMLLAGAGIALPPAAALATGGGESPIMEAYRRMLRTHAAAEAYRVQWFVEGPDFEFEEAKPYEEEYGRLGDLHSRATCDLIHRIARAAGRDPASLSAEYEECDGREHESAVAHVEGGRLFLLVRAYSGDIGSPSCCNPTGGEIYVRPVVVELAGLGKAVQG